MTSGASNGRLRPTERAARSLRLVMGFTIGVVAFAIVMAVWMYILAGAML
ncbi:MAG TPA: hypothetical protein VH723_06255 [Candidatus Limnocylindrales bacterium]